MSHFVLHRIRRMTTAPDPKDVTLGLEAAAYLHWLTCYERDPGRFVCLEEVLPTARKHLADYLAATARETAAHLELMEATRAGAPEAIGTQDFAPPAVDPLPLAPVENLHAQHGLNWILLYWPIPRFGGKPWGYRIYRRGNSTPPALIHTSLENEALLPNQPLDTKFYYTVTAFNGAEETAPSPSYGVQFDGKSEP